MNNTGKENKELLKFYLINNDWGTLNSLLAESSPRKLVNPLFSFLYNRSELLKWRSITMIGRTVSYLAGQNMESARVIMRRLIWNLNDESGGIGWGSPEAMGEIMAQHAGLANEYSTILRSYIREDENFIEHEILQRGVIWGIGRLAQHYPELLKNADESLTGFLESTDGVHRGFAAWALGNLKSRLSMPLLQNLLSDNEEIIFYKDLNLQTLKVNRLAKEALAKIQ